MSPDEIVVTIAAVMLGPVAWVIWFLRASGSALPGRGSDGLGLLGASIVFSALLLLFVLVTAASEDVRTVIEYLFMYSVLGLAWLRLAEPFFAFAGVSVRDDVVERGNSAATIALSGAFLAVMLCFAGGNIGNGPGWWVVVFSAALATAGLLHRLAAHRRDHVEHRRGHDRSRPGRRDAAGVVSRVVRPRPRPKRRR